MLKDKRIVSLPSVVHRSILPFYNFYVGRAHLMNYQAFERFCCDFDIFPDVLSKTKTLNFFTTLASFHVESTADNLVVDEHLFVESLALAAFEIHYKDPQPSPFEKIVLLVEKMN